jgi:hypothetical protein
MKKSRKLSAAHKKAISRSVKAYHSRCKRLNLNNQVAPVAPVELNTNKKRKRDERIAEILKRVRERKSKKLQKSN